MRWNEKNNVVIYFKVISRNFPEEIGKFWSPTPLQDLAQYFCLVLHTGSNIGKFSNWSYHTFLCILTSLRVRYMQK